METATHTDEIAASTHQSRGSARRGPVTLVLDFFSSVRLGICLLTLLFLYATIGSAGIVYPVAFDIFDAENWRHTFMRTWRGIELTEFEWFNTWVFNGLIALICTNLIVTTIRRIPFNALKAGVWMIHTGIVILCIGSVIYFSQKVEGDTPVVRREVLIVFPGTDIAPRTMLALPGNSIDVTGPDGLYRFSIAQIDPNWPILSGADEGKRVYSVSVMVSTPRRQFIRQMLAGFPQYTEDVIPGKGRAKKQAEFGGEAIIDKGIDLSLQFATRDEFWIKDSTALYVRDAGTLPWIERPMNGLPRYNDYLTSPTDVWSFKAGELLPIDPLNVRVPPARGSSEEKDPLAGFDVRVTGYLRYAVPRANLVPGRGATNPTIDVRFLNKSGRSDDARLVALDPRRRSAFNGLVTFQWVPDAAGLEEIAASGKRSLTLRVPGMSAPMTVAVNPEDVSEESEFRPIDGTVYSYRMLDVIERLPLSDGSGEISIVVTEFKGPGGTIKRWVAEEQRFCRDLGAVDPATGHPGMVEADPTIESVYSPSKLGAVTIVGGPGDVGLWALFALDEAGVPRRERLKVGGSAQLSDSLALTVVQFIEDAVEEVRPMIVPREQRQRNIDEMQLASMVKVEISKGDWKQSEWVGFHKYSFETDEYAGAKLTAFEPVAFTLPDGKHVEVIFGQERHSLPHMVALDDFVLTEHVGGYATSGGGGIRDWTSVLRFSTDGKTWSDPGRVSPNKPVDRDGWWYFQATWDPPSGESAGLNFTGLGVGNRHGVYTQLVGCCIAVLGMIYAFYVKPIIRRKRRERVLADVASGRLTSAASRSDMDGDGVHVNGGHR